MFSKLYQSEKSLAREIDKKEGVKNCWNFVWLCETVELKWVQHQKEKSVVVKVGDTISKINQAGKAYCDLCREVLNYGSNGKKVLINHLKCDRHTNLVKAQTSNQALSFDSLAPVNVKQPVFSSHIPVETGGPNSTQTPSSSAASKRPVSLQDRIANQEALVLAVAAELSWPFTSVPVIINLAKALAADPEALNSLSMDRTTSSYKMKFGLAETFTERTLEILQQNKFSLNIDEATSSNTSRVLTLLVNVMDPATGHLTTEHLASLSLIRVDSESVFRAIDELFRNKKIPWKNLISILMDSCAVMRGSKRGLETLIREKRAPHLLDIDGDVCHHVHNASKKFTEPFQNWVEGLFSDVYSEFHWSSGNQDILKEICFLLSIKYTIPQNFIAHRWLSVYDCALSTLIQWKALTLYAFAFLSKEDREVYSSVYNSISHDFSSAAKERLRKLTTDVKRQGRTDPGKKRAARLVDKLFVHRRWTKMILGLYSGALAVLKEYVCLFQSSSCLVHQLHSQQLILFKRFLGMFLEHEAYNGLTEDGLTDSKVLDVTDESKCLTGKEMFLGVITEQELKTANEAIASKFRVTARAAFVSCAQYLQKKLPIGNRVLQAMAVLNPENEHSSTETKLKLKDLPDIVKNMFLVAREEEEEDEGGLPEQDYEVLAEYQKQVLDFCSSANLPPASKGCSVDKWWASVPFDLLRQMSSALMTCFHGPKVESAFSNMTNILDAKSSRMAVSTLSAIQTVRYSLKASGNSAVDSFSRKDKLYAPVNHRLCVNMRGARTKHKDEQKTEQERVESERVALSLKKQKLVSKQLAKARMAEAEKTARIAHKRAIRASSNAGLQALSDALSLKVKPRERVAEASHVRCAVATKKQWRTSRIAVCHRAAVSDPGHRARQPCTASTVKSRCQKVPITKKLSASTPSRPTSVVPSAPKQKTGPPIAPNTIRCRIPKKVPCTAITKKISTPRSPSSTMTQDRQRENRNSWRCLGVGTITPSP